MLSKIIPCLVFHELPRSQHGNDDLFHPQGPHCGQTPSLFISTHCHPPHDCCCGPPTERLPPNGRDPVRVPLKFRSGERLLNLGDPSCLHLELLMHELVHVLASPAVKIIAAPPNTVASDDGAAEVADIDVLAKRFDLEGGATSPSRTSSRPSSREPAHEGGRVGYLANALSRLLASAGTSVPDQLWLWALSRKGKSTIDVTQLVQIHEKAAMPGAERGYPRVGGERCLDTPLNGADLCAQLSDTDCDTADRALRCCVCGGGLRIDCPEPTDENFYNLTAPVAEAADLTRKVGRYETFEGKHAPIGVRIDAFLLPAALATCLVGLGAAAVVRGGRRPGAGQRLTMIVPLEEDASS